MRGKQVDHPGGPDRRSEFEAVVLGEYNLMMSRLYRVWHTNQADEVRLAALDVISRHVLRKTANLLLNAKAAKRQAKKAAKAGKEAKPPAKPMVETVVGPIGLPMDE